MNGTINTTELYSILDMTPASENIMLSGKHGIGKSQILTAYYSSKGCKVVPLFLGQMSDPGDLLGLPSRDDKTGRTVFMPPYWFPKDGQPVVLFLDELNRARPEVLQTVMDLALNRTIANRSLPEGSRIIAAVNEGDEYQLTDLDPALVSRFNVYRFKPKSDEWIAWAKGHAVDARIISFITQYPEFLDGDGASFARDASFTAGICLEKSPDRRGWEHVSLIMQNVTQPAALHQKAIAGIVGTHAAEEFIAFVQNKKLPSAAETLSDFSGCKNSFASYTTADFARLNERIFFCLEASAYKGAAQTAAENLVAYISYLSQNHKREALAHFSTLFESEAYAKANKFIMKRCPSVYDLLTGFISAL